MACVNERFVSNFLTTKPLSEVRLWWNSSKFLRLSAHATNHLFKNDTISKVSISAIGYFLQLGKEIIYAINNLKIMFILFSLNIEDIEGCI